MLTCTDLQNSVTMTTNLLIKSIIDQLVTIIMIISFTSQSHMIPLLNVLLYGGLVKGGRDDRQWGRAAEHLASVKELNYLTQVPHTYLIVPHNSHCLIPHTFLILPHT